MKSSLLRRIVFPTGVCSIVIAGWTLGSFSNVVFPQTAPKVQLPRTNKAEPGFDPKQVTTASQLLQQAVSFIENDQSKAAIPLLREALSLPPNNSQAHHHLGYALWKEGQPEASALEFRRALRLDPTNVYSKYFLARLSDSKGQLAESARLYESIVAAGQPVYDTYSQLSQIYLHLGRKAKALQSLQQAVQQYPLDGALHYRLGQIYKQEGLLKDASRAFETAARLKQTDQSSIQKTLDLSVALQN